jgi:hypothetical protein
MLVKRYEIWRKNVGMIDRVIRVILGIILLNLFLVNMVAAPWSYLVALIGLILLMTGIVGSCPLYSMLGMNTLERKRNKVERLVSPLISKSQFIN